MPEAGYFTNLGLVFPSKELRDPEGIIRRGKAAFPMYGVNSFTTTGTLYKIEFFLIIKAHMSAARDIVLRQPIVVCPLDQQDCKEEMDAIEQAAQSNVTSLHDNSSKRQRRITSIGMDDGGRSTKDGN